MDTVFDEVPVSFLTAVELNDTVAVADAPISKLTDCPVVAPPKLIGPEALRVITYLSEHQLRPSTP